MHNYKTDYHVHPNYSIDASAATIKDFCHKALALKLREICFCTHVELDPERKAKDNFVRLNGEKHSVYKLNWLDSYFKEIIRAQAEFKESGLKIKAGVEIGYCPGVENDIEKIINNYPFDFVMGAIHCLDHLSISSKKESPYYFRSRSAATVREEYFAVLMEAVKTNLFDCIAHIDLYRRYGVQFLGVNAYTLHRGAIEPVFEEMEKREIGIEINTSSRRRGLKEFHPTKEILDLAIKSGIKVFTVGSDAHSLDELGEGLDEALSLLHDMNATNYVFDRRKPVPCSTAGKKLTKTS
ncbi:MAG: histidinol-phosphatase HisJ family protein [Peptococcaceae bacterium]|nr:histidinol-phosphatase HisJ family protein [Peptococcaceae bacterium]